MNRKRKGWHAEAAVKRRLITDGWTVWDLTPSAPCDLLSMRPAHRLSFRWEVEYHEVKFGTARLTAAEDAFATTFRNGVAWNLWRVDSVGAEPRLEMRVGAGP